MLYFVFKLDIALEHYISSCSVCRDTSRDRGLLASLSRRDQMRLSALRRSPAGSLPAAPSPGTQTELVVLLRSIDLIRSAKSLSLSLEYCSALTEILRSSLPLSFSALWPTMFEVRSAVGPRQEETSSSPEILSFTELHYFSAEEAAKRPLADCLHDPLGLVGIMQSFAEDGGQIPNPCSLDAHDACSASSVPAARA